MLNKVRDNAGKIAALCRNEGIQYTVQYYFQSTFGKPIDSFISVKAFRYHPSAKYAEMIRIPFDPESPLVSVIIPVYNGETYLQDTLESLKAQTLQNYEVIFVDDASTDHSVEMLRKAAEKDLRIRVIPKTHENAGASRNCGIQAAKGKYLLFLDSDDTFDPDLLAYPCDRGEQLDTQVVIFDADQLKLPEKIKTKPDWMKATRHLPKKVFAGVDEPKGVYQTFNPWTKMFRRDYILREGFQFQSQYSSNDVYFSVVALSAAERIATVPARLVHYHVGRSGNIQSQKDKDPLCIYNAFAGAREELKRRNLLSIFDDALTARAEESIRHEMDSLKSEAAKERLLDVLRSGGYERLGIQNPEL